MAGSHRIIKNEAYGYTATRLNPGVGAIHLYPRVSWVRRAFSWMRWWHWAMLGFSLLMLLDSSLR